MLKINVFWIDSDFYCFLLQDFIIVSTWKIEGTPLEETQKRLSQKGLHDPWLRNEVWKYKLDIKSASPIKVCRMDVSIYLTL